MLQEYSHSGSPANIAMLCVDFPTTYHDVITWTGGPSGITTQICSVLRTQRESAAYTAAYINREHVRTSKYLIYQHPDVNIMIHDVVFTGVTYTVHTSVITPFIRNRGTRNARTEGRAGSLCISDNETK
jgi:hypothetical protein